MIIMIMGMRRSSSCRFTSQCSLGSEQEGHVLQDQSICKVLTGSNKCFILRYIGRCLTMIVSASLDRRCFSDFGSGNAFTIKASGILWVSLDIHQYDYALQRFECRLGVNGLVCSGHDDLMSEIPRLRNAFCTVELLTWDYVVGDAYYHRVRTHTRDGNLTSDRRDTTDSQAS